MERVRNLYKTSCPVCGGSYTPKNLSARDDDEFTSIISNIAKQLYTQKLQTGTIPQALYEKTAAQLMDSVFAGLGGKSFTYDDPNNGLLTHLRQNVYSFSAAKSLTQMQLFNDLLTGPDGKLRSESEFIAAVAKTGAEFNKTYLATERDSAIANAQTAESWNNFADDEILEILTAGDNRVRPEHAILDHFTAPKSDDVWRRLCPPFDWRCRCKLSPGLVKNIKEYNTGDMLKDAKVSKYFQNNPGISKIIYKDDHPYYHNSFNEEKEL